MADYKVQQTNIYYVEIKDCAHVSVGDGTTINLSPQKDTADVKEPVQEIKKKPKKIKFKNLRRLILKESTSESFPAASETTVKPVADPPGLEIPEQESQKKSRRLSFKNLRRSSSKKSSGGGKILGEVQTNENKGYFVTPRGSLERQ